MDFVQRKWFYIFCPYIRMWLDICIRKWFDICIRMWFDICIRKWFDICIRKWFDICIRMWPLKLPPSVLPSSPSVPQLHTLHNVNAVGTSTARCASATHTALLLVSTLLGIESPARTRRIEQQQRKFNVSQTLFYLIFSIALFPIFIPLCHKIVIRHLLFLLHCFFL